MARLAKAWPCLASAVLVNLAFAPFNLSLLVFAALAPWLVSLRGTSGKEGFRSGWTFGFLTMLGQLLFLFTFVNRWIHDPAISLIPYLLASAFAALYFGILGWQISLCWKHKLPWAIPIVWAGMEVFRSYIPALAFPYGLIATPLWTFPSLIQTAYYGSIFLVGAWVLLLNLILALFLAGEGSWSRIRGYAILFVLSIAVSMVRYQSPVSGDKMVMAIGQPGVDLAFGSKEQNAAQLRSTIAQFYTEAHRFEADLLVLPEGIGSSFEIDKTMPVLFGDQRVAEKTPDMPEVRYQTAFSYDKERGLQYADKTRLVIFGEYVPFRHQLPIIASTFQMPNGDLIPGDEVKTLQIGKLKVGPILCFEGLFPDIAYRQARQGAQLLAVMSVDDWYMGTAAPDQLKAGGVWRAVETGLPLVRSASLGYSYAVEPRGNIIAEIPLKEARVARVELPRGESGGFPLFPVFPLGSLLALVALPVYAKWNSRRPS